MDSPSNCNFNSGIISKIALAVGLYSKYYKSICLIDPPSGTPPQVRIGVSEWDRTRGRMRDGRWESKAFRFMCKLFLRAFGEGSVLGCG